MSTSSYDTKEAQQKQRVSFDEQEWLRLQQHLPADWQEQARIKNAWTRTRNLRSIADLLRALLVYAACGFSFRQLGIWGTLTGLASLSERAWRKRLTKAGPWIDGLVATLIGPGCTPAWLPKTHGGRILLIDGTCLKMPAGKGNDSKLHTAYDLHAGRLAQVRLTPREGAEGIHHFELQPQDVTVTDAGYHLGSSFAEEQKQGAYGVHRFSAHQERLEQENGKKLDLKRVVKHQKYGTVTHWKAWVWNREHRERFAIRLIIALPARKEAMAARARKRERMRANYGKKYNQAPIWWAGVQLFATTLPAHTWSAVEVVKLYRARWQIELFFKRLKQGLWLYGAPVKIWERAQTYVHLCLLLWYLQEQETQELARLLQGVLVEPQGESLLQTGEAEQAAQEQESSYWMLEQCVVQTVCGQLRGSWTLQRIRDCLPELRRYLSWRGRSKRPLQRRTTWLWLTQRDSLMGTEACFA